MNRDLSIEHLFARALAFLVLAIYVSNKLIPLAGEQLEWAVYEVIGLCGPLFVLLGFWGNNVSNSLNIRLINKLLSYTLLLFLMFLFVLFLMEFDFYTILYPFVIFAVLVANPKFRDLYLANNAISFRRYRKLLLVFLLFAGCCFSLSSQPWWIGNFAKYLQSDNKALLISIVATVLATGSIYSYLSFHPPTLNYLKYRYVFEVFAIFVFLLFSFRVQTDPHHYSYYSGPIELVRQGGWLLWDVPSQYGFLNILLVAFLPVKSVALSLYLIVGTCNFLTNILVYYFFRKVSSNFLLSIFFFLITFSTINLLPGMAPEMNGLTCFPSIGGFRFIWGYILIFIIFKVSDTISDKNFIYLSVLGNLVWVISCLWSIESLVYSSFAWLPGYFLLVMNRYELYSRLSFKAKHLMLLVSPFLYLLFFISLIDIYYLLFNGNLPDWQAFYEYALSYKNGIGALPVNSLASFWFIIVLFSVLIAAIFYYFTKKQYKHIPLLCSTYCFLWAVSSYFVSRSHETTILNLFPIFIFVFAIVLVVIQSNKNVNVKMLTLAFVPLLMPVSIFVITAGINNYFTLDYLRRTLPVINSYDAFFEDPLTKIKSDFPYLSQLNIKNISFMGLTLAPESYHKFGDTHIWLPFAPYTAFIILDPARRITYLERYAQHFKNEGGWILFNPDNVHPAAFEWLYKNYTAGRIFFEKGLILQELISKK